MLVASRSFINGSVPTIGEFLPFPDSPRQLWSDFVSGWNAASFGATSPNPTGLAVLAVGSVLWLFHMGLGLTMIVVGPSCSAASASGGSPTCSRRTASASSPSSPTWPCRCSRA